MGFKVKPLHGLNSSHHNHLAIDRRIPDRRLWFWLQIARPARDDSDHHPDPLAARTDLGSKEEVEPRIPRHGGQATYDAARDVEKLRR